MIDVTQQPDVQQLRSAGAKPITLADGTHVAHRQMQRTWQAEVSQAKTEQREPVMPRFVPTDDSVRQVLVARARRAVRAEKRARLAARPALGVIAFLCWATKRHMQVNVEVAER